MKKEQGMKMRQRNKNKTYRVSSTSEMTQSAKLNYLTYTSRIHTLRQKTSTRRQVRPLKPLKNGYLVERLAK